MDPKASLFRHRLRFLRRATYAHKNFTVTVTVTVIHFCRQTTRYYDVIIQMIFKCHPCKSATCSAVRTLFLRCAHTEDTSLSQTSVHLISILRLYSQYRLIRCFESYGGDGSGNAMSRDSAGRVNLP